MCDTALPLVILVVTLLDLILEASGVVLVLRGIYHLISVIFNTGNTSYVRNLWRQHPELKGKYYWSEGLWDGSQGWSSIIGLYSERKSDIDRKLKESLNVLDIMNHRNTELVNEYDKIPKSRIQRIR